MQIFLCVYVKWLQLKYITLAQFFAEDNIITIKHNYIEKSVTKANIKKYVKLDNYFND